MIDVRNDQLLASQESLQELSEQPLRGVHALALGDIMDEAQGRLERLHELRQGLIQRVEDDGLTEQEADEEWREVLEETSEIDAEPLPQSAVEEIEISAGHLMTLGWLINRD